MFFGVVLRFLRFLDALIGYALFSGPLHTQDSASGRSLGHRNLGWELRTPLKLEDGLYRRNHDQSLGVLGK